MDPSCWHHSLQDPNTQLNWTFEVVLLFSYQLALPNFVGLICFWTAKAFVFYHIRFCLSSTFFLLFFSSFFQGQKLFLLLSEATVIFYHIFFICQALFYSLLYFCQKSKRKYGEGGIWTLAPRKRSTPLAGAPLQPLEYFSKTITDMNCLNA